MEAKGSKNAYICDKLHATVTLHKDAGTTPMFIRCPQCNGPAVSRMGKVDKDIPATHEWYKPSDQDVEAEVSRIDSSHRKIYKTSLMDHVKQGGLLMRPISTPETKEG